MSLQLESARKLRWYDREDLSGLVEQNTREKKALQSTIATLRQVTEGPPPPTHTPPPPPSTALVRASTIEGKRLGPIWQHCVRGGGGWFAAAQGFRSTRRDTH